MIWPGKQHVVDHLVWFGRSWQVVAWPGRSGPFDDSYPGRPVDRFLPNPRLRLLDPCREGLRFRRLSPRTGQAYCEWSKRFIRFWAVFLRSMGPGGHDAVQPKPRAPSPVPHTGSCTPNSPDPVPWTENWVPGTGTLAPRTSSPVPGMGILGPRTAFPVPGTGILEVAKPCSVGKLGSPLFSVE